MLSIESLRRPPNFTSTYCVMLLRHLFSIDFLFYSATNEAVAVGVSALCSDQWAAAVPFAALSAGTRVQSSGGHSANHIGGQFPGCIV